jgi:hypothetical protein
MTLLIPSPENRTFNRVGIIAKAAISIDDAPPGITRFLEYVGKPWKGLVGGYGFQIVGQVDKTEAYTDRCVHTVTKPELGDNSHLLSLNFDWQRTFEAGQALRKEILASALSSAEKSAIAYFEDLAEGNRFDVDAI